MYLDCYTDTKNQRTGQPQSLNPDICNDPGSHSEVPDLLNQIQTAFEKRPDVANTLHGQRRIHQGGRGRRTALFSSRKCGGTIPVESRLELSYAVLLEGSSNIANYRTQAIRIQLPERRSAFPDFLVLTKCGQFEVHEVKPSISHLSPKDAKRFDIMEVVLRSFGIRFQLIDASSLPSGRKLEDLLLRYTRGHFKEWTPAQITLGLSLLNDQPRASFLDAYRFLTEHDLPWQLVDYLSFHGLWVPMTVATPISHSGDA